MTHKSAWIRSKRALLEVGEAETPNPRPDELLVNVKVIGFSPIEAKQQQFELHPFPYPQNLGLSYAGVIEKVGPNVKNFAAGDRIVAVRPEDKLDDPRYGSFQQYAIASPVLTSKLLPDTPFEAAASVILNLATVVSALTVFLGLDRCDLDGNAQQNGKKVLIYGGSSASGGLAINYATAGGYEIVTTSSPKNWNHVTSLAPGTTIIDHTQAHEKIVKDIEAEGPYDAILDTIGTPPVTNILVEYLSKIGGGRYNTLIPLVGGEKPIPENVERRFESYGWVFTDPKNADLKDWFLEKLLPEGLSKGVIVPTPPQWVEGGLENTQQALDMMFKGEVSGTKLVMDPWSS